MNFESCDLGPLENLHSYELKHPAIPTPVRGKVFLGERLHLTSMEVSINKLPAGRAVPFLHKHRTHEELYAFIRGHGQFLVDGKVIEIQEGTCIRVAPGAARAWRNNSTEDLYYVVVQATDGSMKSPGIADGMRVDEPVVWP